MAEPDFQALARAWVQGDPRLEDMARSDPGRAEALACRLAEALELRRGDTSPPADEPRGDLVVHVHRSRLDPKTGMDAEALDQLAEFVEETARSLPPPDEEG